MSLRYPTAPKWGMKLFKVLIGHKLSFSRSSSVAAEASRLNRRATLRRMFKYILALVMLLVVKRIRG
jgi:hypothetical protein